jgi:hypothetical protein
MRAEFYQFLAAYESNDECPELPMKFERLESRQEPLLVVATESVDIISSNPNQTGFDNARVSVDETSSHGETHSGDLDLNQRMKLKADFDSAFKESLEIKKSLAEITKTSVIDSNEAR